MMGDQIDGEEEGEHRSPSAAGINAPVLGKDLQTKPFSMPLLTMQIQFDLMGARMVNACEGWMGTSCQELR